MNIIKRELKGNLKSLLIWSGVMIFLVYVGMVKYSGFAAAGETVNEMMQALPDPLKKMFGLAGLDLTQISAFYGMFYLYFVLLGGIHAVMLGATIISKEERDKTADFLLVKPVIRSTIITAKLIAAFIQVVILNVVTCVSSIFFVDMFNKGEPITDGIIHLMTALFIIQVIFLALGLGISSLTKNTKKATGLSTLVLLVMFMLNIAIDLEDKLKPLTFLSPFKYFNPNDVLQGKAFDFPYILLSLALMIIGIVITYLFYQKKDIHS